MFEPDEPQPSALKRVCCFFMCPGVRPRMAAFYYMIAFIFGMVGLFLAAGTVARQFGFGHQYNGAMHATWLIVMLMAHIPLVGLRYEDTRFRDPDRTCDPMMMRQFAMMVFVVLGFGLATQLTVEKWWSDPMSEHEFVYGKPPQHASPSSSMRPTPLPLTQFFRSATPTPSQTPSSSPDPRILEREFQRQSDNRSIVGALYMGSVLCAAGTVITDYLMRTATAY